MHVCANSDVGVGGIDLIIFDLCEWKSYSTNRSQADQTHLLFDRKFCYMKDLSAVCLQVGGAAGGYYYKAWIQQNRSGFGMQAVVPYDLVLGAIGRTAERSLSK